MRADWQPVDGFIYTNEGLALLSIRGYRIEDPHHKFRIKYIAHGYQVQILVPRIPMERCDLCPHRHRRGSRAWFMHLGGRAPEDIALPG